MTSVKSKTANSLVVAFNYSSQVDNSKTAGHHTNEPLNAKRLMRTYLSRPTECHDYQFAQHAHFSAPAGLSQPAKKET